MPKQAPRHIRHGGVEVNLHVFLTSAMDDGKWSASRPVRLTSEKTAPVPTGE